MQQIQEREAERIRARELKEQESNQLLQQAKEREQKDAEEKKLKVLAGRQLLQEIMESNNDQAQAKLRKKQEAIDEDLKIAEYLKAKELKDLEKEAEVQRRKAEKERVCLLLLSLHFCLQCA